MTTATKTDPALVSHLLRRAGFGSDITETNHYTSQSYERLVEDLLNPEKFPDVDDNVIGRYYPSLAACKDDLGPWVTRWFYRMINTKRPLRSQKAGKKTRRPTIGSTISRNPPITDSTTN